MQRDHTTSRYNRSEFSNDQELVSVIIVVVYIGTQQLNCNTVKIVIIVEVSLVAKIIDVVIVETTKIHLKNCL
jgi:hypothetical protein